MTSKLTNKTKENKSGGDKIIMQHLSLYSYNVRGMRNTLKRARVINYIEKNCNEIVYLQETHTTMNMKKIIQK